MFVRLWVTVSTVRLATVLLTQFYCAVTFHNTAQPRSNNPWKTGSYWRHHTDKQISRYYLFTYMIGVSDIDPLILFDLMLYQTNDTDLPVINYAHTTNIVMYVTWTRRMPPPVVWLSN